MGLCVICYCMSNSGLPLSMESWLSWECSHGDRHTSCLSLGMRESSFSELLTLTFFSLSLLCSLIILVEATYGGVIY